MAEVQQSVNSGEMTERFLSFVMMQAQQASIFLGDIPHPQTGKPAVNLEAAKLFIDQLEMIQEKTRGNLTADESRILSGILADLQMAYVRAVSAPAPSAAAESTPPPAPAGSASTEPVAEETDDDTPRKRFSKSYGA